MTSWAPGARLPCAPRLVRSDAYSFSTFGLSLGTHFISAVYSGDSNFVTSRSPTLKQVVSLAIFGANVPPTPRAGAPGSGASTGTVAFDDGSTYLSAGTLSGDSARFGTATDSVGAHSLKVAYGGDNIESSTSILPQVAQDEASPNLAVSIGPPVDGAIASIQDNLSLADLVNELAAEQVWSKRRRPRRAFGI
jgi:hypothetical protein